MRIGIYDPYLDDLGGGEKYMLSIASCLSQEHDVDVFWNNKEDMEEFLKRFTIDLSRVKIKKNIFSQDVSFFRRVLISKSYDIIIVLSDGSIPFLLSKKIFVHIQVPITNIKISLKTKLKLLRVKKIFCNSYFTKSYTDKIFNTVSRVLYPPITFSNKKISKENIILHVGRFRVKNVGVGDYKKQSIMVDTFKKMVDQGVSSWKFVIAAGVKDQDKKEFNEMVKSAKNFPIEFLVNRSNEELLDLYGKARIYWHASGYGEDLDTHPEYAEHFGISTVEAMSGGAVPVVINAGGQKEIVENGESGFLWNTLDELIKCTDKLIKNKGILDEMSEKAIRRSKKFSGSRFCEELKEIIFK